MRDEMPRLFLVTSDEAVSRADFIEVATAALAAGGHGCALQLRAHGSHGSKLYEIAVRLRQVATAMRASFWVNDRIDVAAAVRADGVQLGSRSVSPAEARRLLGRTCRIGRSVHGASEVSAAIESGADVAVLGNIYRTASHPDREPLGPDAIRRAAALPIVAIGGITPKRVEEVVGAGAWGVAVSSGVWEAGDVEAAVRDYRRALVDATGGGSGNASS